MAALPVSAARAALPELLARVAAGEEVTLTRHGRAVAVVVRPDVLAHRRADRSLAEADDLLRILDTAGSLTDSTPGLDAAWADELVREIRADRDGAT